MKRSVTAQRTSSTVLSGFVSAGIQLGKRTSTDAGFPDDDDRVDPSPISELDAQKQAERDEEEGEEDGRHGRRRRQATMMMVLL